MMKRVCIQVGFNFILNDLKFENQTFITFKIIDIDSISTFTTSVILGQLIGFVQNYIIDIITENYIK